jgi:hypothetical protein
MNGSMGAMGVPREIALSAFSVPVSSAARSGSPNTASRASPMAKATAVTSGSMSIGITICARSAIV